MKSLIRIAAVLLALSGTAANAAEIPAEYRGEWCEHNSIYFVPRAIGKCQRGGDGWIKITAKTYEYYRVKCSVTRIKTDEIQAHIVSASCPMGPGEDTELQARRLITTTGTAGRGKRLYIEELDR